MRFSLVGNASVRLPSLRLLKGRALGSLSFSKIARSMSSREKKRVLRSMRAMRSPILPASPSTLALCFGLRAPVGMMAVLQWSPNS